MTPDQQNDLFLTLGRIEGKVDSLLEKSSDHETRLRSLERVKNFGLGIVAVCSAAIALLVEGVRDFFVNKCS